MKALNEFWLLVSIILLFLGFQTFMVGFHNVDSCATKHMLLSSYGLPMHDEMRLDGRIWSLDECYLSGLKAQFHGFYISTIAAFLMGYSLVYMRCAPTKRKKK